MGRTFTLEGRHREILTAVAKGYIATGEPVGSKSVSEKRRDGLSPASIRNAMAELEAEGYLTHPHTSAGRVPTDKGLRSYVGSLTAPPLDAPAAELVRTRLQEASSLEERMALSSQLLAALTRQVGIVAVSPLSEAVLEHIHFTPLSEGRVLAVVVARGEMVEHRIIRTGEAFAAEELDRIAAYVNENFAGWTLASARAEILRRIQQERAAYDAILRRLRLLCLAGFLRAEWEAQLRMEGATNLIGGVLDPERLAPLLRALEEKEKLIALLDECIREDMRLAAPGAGGDSPLCVRIGLDQDPAMKHVALIGAVCELEPGLAGRIAVIGPTRMPYELVMAAVAHVAGVLSLLGDS